MKKFSGGRNLELFWWREGDKNTKFFHRLTNSNRRNNIVDSLFVSSSLLSDSIEIMEHIVQFYM
jgi:hypothetical protein